MKEGNIKKLELSLACVDDFGYDTKKDEPICLAFGIGGVFRLVLGKQLELCSKSFCKGIFLLICLLVSPNCVNAEEYHLTFFSENDLYSFNNKDRYYTAGMKFSMTLPKSFELGLGHQIFNPNDNESFLISENDRPYAGYLYTTLGKHFLNEHTSNVSLSTIEIALGLTGPKALGEQLQNSVHAFLEIHHANAWQFQVQNEFMAMLTLAHSASLNAKRIASEKDVWGWDVLPRASVSLGTPYTMFTLGGEVRYGWNLPVSFFTPTIRHANGIRMNNQNILSAYFFTTLEAQVVLWNTFLDGNLSGKRSPTVDKYPFVFEVLAGFVVSFKRFTGTYTQTFRSKEFRGQDGVHFYNSLSVSYNF